MVMQVPLLFGRGPTENKKIQYIPTKQNNKKIPALCRKDKPVTHTKPNE